MKTAFIIFWGQLVLNVLWSVVFFGLKSPLGGVVVIVLLWIAILASIVAFSHIVPVTRWLLTPYIVWVSIAAYLNVNIWQLN